MKFLFAIVFSLTLCPSVVLANGSESQAGYSRSRTCTRNEYREEYIPGTQESPGYVRSWSEVVEVPCDSAAIKKKIDDNDCKEGSLLGGLLGAGITMSATRGKDRWWAVPAGGAAGAMIGCQVDGG